MPSIAGPMPAAIFSASPPIVSNAAVRPPVSVLIAPVANGLNASMMRFRPPVIAASKLPHAPSNVVVAVAACLATSVHAQVEQRLVELLGGDLPLGHRVAEIARVGAPRRRAPAGSLPLAPGMGVGELVEVLGGQLALAGGLGEDHADRFEGFLVASGYGVEVARGFGELVVVGHAVGCELCGDALDVAKVVDGLCPRISGCWR